jgi:2-polyprenyl-6-methoxyphenol hydroxylase-like FAD-dependent oxidoreductase
MNSKEITIIGAGSAGLSAGVFLHALGYKPTIYEKRDRVPITKAIGVNPVTLKLFEQSGITKRFFENGWKLETFNFWYEEDLIYKNSFKKVNHAYPFMLIQPQHETEQIIENYLAENGIEVKRHFDLKNLTQNDKGVQIELENLDQKTLFKPNNQAIIIGADGSKSKVREFLGINFSGKEHQTLYTLYDIELETPLSHKEGHYKFFKNGSMIMLHIRDGVWRVGGNLENILEYLPKGTKTGKISWETNFTISEKVADKFSEGNVFLIGDAAHIHSPLGGKGMNMCIEDGYIFSNHLANGKEQDYSKNRISKIKSVVAALGQLTEVVGGNHFIGKLLRRSMRPFSFLFPLFMPSMRKFLLGLK